MPPSFWPILKGGLSYPCLVSKAFCVQIKYLDKFVLSKYEVFIIDSELGLDVFAMLLIYTSNKVMLIIIYRKKGSTINDNSTI